MSVLVPLPKNAQEREAAHEAKILDVIRTRIREARRAKLTGEMTVRIQMMKGGPSNIYTEVGVTYKILEEG